MPAGAQSRDAGATLTGILHYRKVIYSADGETLRQAHRRALARGVPMAVYTMDMFTTGNDDDNRAVVRAVAAADLQFAGLALHGPRNAVDKVFKGVTLHA